MMNFKGKKYFITTYGCQMNVHESEKISGAFSLLGMTTADKLEDADVIVFNTCCIREGAEDKAFSNVAVLKKYKQTHPNIVIILCGCMPQQKNGKYDFSKKLPFVDIVIGTFNLHLVGEYLQKYSETKKRIFEIFDKHVENEDLIPSIRDNKDNAYVNIIYGCNNFCSYCIVPYVRGRERSRALQDIVCEVKGLVEKGYKSITLLGQNVNSYGKDLKNQNLNFAILLRELCKIDGDFKISFMTSHPKDLSDEVIDALVEEDKIEKHLHLPMQSGSDKILKAMNRNYTFKRYLSIINKIKKLSPNFTFSTDIIVGFPGETYFDFLKTANAVKKIKFAQIFAFMYSKRTGTPACEFKHQVPEKIKNKRVNILLAIEKNIQKNMKKRKENHEN